MKKIFLFIFFISETLIAQVGVNTTDPKSQLEIKASSTTSPINTDGILIPRMSAFPTGVGANQNGMLIYLTAAVGSKSIGFYYWDNSTTSWLGLYSSTSTVNDVAVTNFEDFIFDEYDGAGGPNTNGKNDNQYSFTPVSNNVGGPISDVDGTSAFFNTYAPGGVGGNDYTGLHYMSTGTSAVTNSPTAGGRAGLGASDWSNRIRIGGKEVIYEIRVKFAALSTASQTYISYLGLSDLVGFTAVNITSLQAGNSIQNGLYFKYTTAGLVGSKTIGGVTTSTAATAISAGVWYKLKAIIGTSGTADFYLNDVNIGSLTTMTTNPMKFNFLIEKTNGTSNNPSIMYIDYVSWRMVR